jgi:TIR domain-containing protein
MKVFISWSGARSEVVASAMRQFLQDVVQLVEPWMSRSDIEAGSRWGRAIEGELADTRFGIICLTQDNLLEPWIHFEAGALAKTVQDTYVCPYLIDLSAEQLPSGPLTQFQAKQATARDTWDMVRAVNNALKERSQGEADVKRRFDKWWPELESATKNLPAIVGGRKAKRPIEDIVSETLVLVRLLAAQGEERPTKAAHDESLHDWMQMMQARRARKLLLSAQQRAAVERNRRNIEATRAMRRAQAEGKADAEGLAKPDDEAKGD